MAAKTYRDVKADAHVVILDRFPTIGGVWAEHQLYPSLKTNNILGTYEYSDFPMTGENSFGVKPGEHIPGHVVHAYLKKFAQTFGIYDKCRFGEELQTARQIESGGWELTIQGERSYRLRTHKLILATGLHSTPFLPTIPGAAESSIPIFHGSGLLKHSENLFTNAQSVAILGAAKSAWDIAYTFASRGIHVDMIIRESGRGPVWMAPPSGTPLKGFQIEKFVSTRFFTWFSKCSWSDADGFTGVRGFLHGTAVGRAMVKTFWRILGNGILTLHAYDKHPETAKLKPWAEAPWVACGLSSLNYPTNFFDLVKEGKITIYIADIDQLSGKEINLTSTKEGKTTVTADALICATGFQFLPSVTFLSPSGKPLDPSTIGIPHHSESEESKHLIEEVDKEILSRFPKLKDQPKVNPNLKPLDREVKELNQPYVLYRFMVPPAFINDRSLAFCGIIQAILTPLGTQVQGLWLAAYLTGKLELKDKDDQAVKKEAMLHARFGKLKCPRGNGSLWPRIVFDSMPYFDQLLHDLGMNPWRKRGVLKESFEPYGVTDYVGLVEEWKQQQGEVSNKQQE